MKNIFQIFGSKSSLDYDVMVFVNEIPLIVQCDYLTSKFNTELTILFKELNMPFKKVNSNLGILSPDGTMLEVYKGTADEVNNSLFLTYSLHRQLHPPQIKNLLPRDKDLKLLRAVRIILSFLSRTENRVDIKRALKGDFTEKIKVLASIDFSSLRGKLNKKEQDEDTFKTIAFQYAQALGLYDGREIYTKEDIFNFYPDLETLIIRSNKADLSVLNTYRDKLVAKGNERIPVMPSLFEYKYRDYKF